MNLPKLAVIGAGSWGTALAVVLSPRFDTIALWAHEPDLAAQMAAGRENTIFLPGFALAGNIRPTADLEQALAGASIVLSVMPSKHTRGVYTRMLPFLDASMAFVSATKGIENGSLLRMSQVIPEVVRARFEPRVAVLSGPTFAREIARGEPAAVVIASEYGGLAEVIQTAFAGPSLRLYTASDVIGVELGAALKNVIAIAAGVCTGLEFGSNAMAALITRGLAEITRLAVVLGGSPRTLAGLAGLGDLVLTCTGDLSRNRAVGIQLAKNKSLPDILANMRMVAEGVETTRAAVHLARRAGVEMPITEQMFAILEEGKPAREALKELMERSLKPE